MVEFIPTANESKIHCLRRAWRKLAGLQMSPATASCCKAIWHLGMPTLGVIGCWLGVRTFFWPGGEVVDINSSCESKRIEKIHWISLEIHLALCTLSLSDHVRKCDSWLRFLLQTPNSRSYRYVLCANSCILIAQIVWICSHVLAGPGPDPKLLHQRLLSDPIRPSRALGIKHLRGHRIGLVP